jgi:predicted nucleic acid-binding protein
MRGRDLSPPGVFVDSSGYYAATDTDDSNHQRAVEITHLLEERRWPLYTTNFVLAETHALLLRRLNRVIALRVLQSLRSSCTIQMRVT